MGNILTGSEIAKERSPFEMNRFTNLDHLKFLYKKSRNLLLEQLKNISKIVFKERIGIAYTAPSDMPIEDRLFLFSIVRAFKPCQALREVGVSKGGSALIITNAMEDNKAGTLVGIDPFPKIGWRKEAFYNRYKLVKNNSPDAIPEAVGLLGGQLDFVLLDSIHIFDQVYGELKTILPWMSEDGIILIHDAFHYGVNAAIKKIIKEHKDVIDCGFINRTPDATVSPLDPLSGCTC